MKYILLCMCLLSLLGCGTDTKTQQDTKPTTTANEQVKLYPLAIMLKPLRKHQLLLRIILIMQRRTPSVASLRR